MSSETLRYAYSLYAKGEYKSALQLYDEKQKMGGSSSLNGEHRLAYAWCLQERLRYAESMVLTKKILQENPTDATALVNYAICLGKQNSHREALTYFDKILDSDPKYVPRIGYYAYLLERTGDFEKAAIYYKKALDLEPDNLWYISHYAFFLHKARKLEDSEKWFKKTLELSPENTWVIKRYVYLLRDLYGDGKANAYYEELINTDSANANHYINYAELKILQGYHAEAGRILQEATSLNNPLVISIIIRVYLTTLSILQDDGQVDESLKKLRESAQRYGNYIHRDYTDLKNYMRINANDMRNALFDDVLLTGSNAVKKTVAREQ
ncbi:MAG: tetratricopeptide repeat protein [Chitinivibrionales bacterium]|nr:tetratricopeptide repeat protein [Chitinivibrionales bacterium]